MSKRVNSEIVEGCKLQPLIIVDHARCLVVEPLAYKQAKRLVSSRELCTDAGTITDNLRNCTPTHKAPFEFDDDVPF